MKYGVPEAAPPTKTYNDFWHHPLNPTYTSVQVPKIKMLPKYGYALVEDELPRRELDDEILAKENVILQQRLMLDDAVLKAGSPRVKRKQNVGEPDLNSNYMDMNNNSNTINSSSKKRNKSSLNVEVQASSTCPGLATSAVSYKLD